MKKVWLFPVFVLAVAGAGLAYRSFIPAKPNEKIYVAVEGESKIAAIDPAARKIIASIGLSVEHDGGLLNFHPHNVQVSPDNKTVWVTANAGESEGHDSHGFLGAHAAYAHGDEKNEESDAVIIINPITDKIIKRVPIAPGAHLSHVALTPDGLFAYVAAQKEGAVYKIDAEAFKIVKRVPMSENGEPHGIRISPDGSAAYIAMLGSKSLGIIDIKTDSFSEIPLDGQAVQTGVTADGKIVVVSLYDKKQLAVYKTETKAVKYIQLPASAKGPVQMYTTPDSDFAYLADQGYYFNQPAGELVYKIDLKTLTVVKSTRAGRGPHGVVISPDGKFVYVTNLLSGDISVIDAAKDEEIARVYVGKEPNGISVWKR